MMKGIDITGLPSLPRHFVVRKGCRSDIFLGSDDDNDDLNKAIVGGEGDINHTN